LQWLRGIAANVIRNLLRRQRLRQSDPLDEANPRAARPADSDALERSEWIARTLDALPERQEAVLRAKYLEQMSVAQIAGAWGESEKAVESLLTRARAAFRLASAQDQLSESIQKLE
jgi:RNA polymerase sigma-70 factor (ECF subfamily)